MIEKIKEYQTVIFLVLVFVMGWIAHGMYSDSVVKAIEETRKEAAQSAATEIAKITITNTTVQGKVIERIRTEQVYSECQHSPDTYELIKGAFK